MKPNGLSDDLVRQSPNGNTRGSGGYNSRSSASDASAPTGQAAVGEGGGWTSYNGSTGGNFDESALGGGFGDSGEEQSNRPNQLPHRTRAAISTVIQGTGEVVTVTLLPEKEGMFLFQHRNYEVKSLRRGTSVVRRFSDFVWLLDCLQKRYPFRRLPLLPPKRLQGKFPQAIRTTQY